MEVWSIKNNFHFDSGHNFIDGVDYAISPTHLTGLDQGWSQKELDKEVVKEIIKEISSEYSLEGLMLKLKLQYFGHLM